MRNRTNGDTSNGDRGNQEHLLLISPVPVGGIPFFVILYLFL